METAIRNDVKQITKDTHRRLDQLIIQQQEERRRSAGEIARRHSIESQKEATDITSGKRREDFDRISNYKPEPDYSPKGKEPIRAEFTQKADREQDRQQQEDARDKSAATREAFDQNVQQLTEDREDKRSATREAFSLQEGWRGNYRRPQRPRNQLRRQEPQGEWRFPRLSRPRRRDDTRAGDRHTGPTRTARARLSPRSATPKKSRPRPDRRPRQGPQPRRRRRRAQAPYPAEAKALIRSRKIATEAT